MEPTITTGFRSPQDRGRPLIRRPAEVGATRAGLGVVPRAVAAKSAKDVKARRFEILLQSEAPSYICQLTSPADVWNAATGRKITAQPLVMGFGTLGGFHRLDLRKEADRRKWRFVVGHDAWEQSMKELGLPTTLHPDDEGDLPVPHPRYGLGLKFWNVDDASRAAKKARFSAFLDQLATDEETRALVFETEPEKLAELLDRRKAELEKKDRKAKKLGLHAAEVAEADDEGGGEDGSDEPEAEPETEVPARKPPKRK